MVFLKSGPRKLRLIAPPSKSHALRLILADYLAGDYARLEPAANDCEDVLAMKRCLKGDVDCGESAAVYRFLKPVFAALGRSFELRPAPTLKRRLEANAITSQTITGQLFAAPLLTTDSLIPFPAQSISRGYVDLTLKVLEDAGIAVERRENCLFVPGSQRYHAQPQTPVEGCWSSAAMCFAMNALGSECTVEGLELSSLQPDRAIVEILKILPETLDVSPFPDLYPILRVVYAALKRPVAFRGTERLRFKECDRVSAMDAVMAQLGECPFNGGKFPHFNDHRIVFALAVASTVAKAPIELENIDCVCKSYPEFGIIYNQ